VTIQELDHEVIIQTARHFHQGSTLLNGFVLHVSRDVFIDHILAKIIVPVDCLHGEQIHHTPKCSFRPNGNLHGDGDSAQAVFNALDGVIVGRTHAIHFVHKTDPRHVVAVRLAPNGFALWLHPLDSIKNDHTTIQHPQASLDFSCKVNMTGCINDINAIIFPFSRYRCRNNGNSPLALLGHPVRNRGTIIHRTNPIGLAGKVQDPLGCCGFTGVNMGNDPNIAVPL